MASDTNQVVLIGRLTRDSEMKYTQGGMALTKFSLANGYRTKKGEQWVDESNFFDVTLFGKSAESLAQYLLKGTQVCVVGELRQDRWEQDGQKRSSVGIVARDVQLLARPQNQAGGQQGGGQGQTQGQTQRPPAQAARPAVPEIYTTPESSVPEDDIPF